MYAYFCRWIDRYFCGGHDRRDEGKRGGGSQLLNPVGERAKILSEPRRFLEKIPNKDNHENVADFFNFIENVADFFNFIENFADFFNFIENVADFLNFIEQIC